MAQQEGDSTAGDDRARGTGQSWRTMTEERNDERAGGRRQKRGTIIAHGTMTEQGDDDRARKR